jgi:hypothetical protein
LVNAALRRREGRKKERKKKGREGWKELGRKKA